MKHTVQVSIARDADGFTTQECPACHSRFKVRFEKGSGRPLSYCPYCRHHGHSCWWTPEQARYLAAMAGEQVIGPMLDRLSRSFNASQRGNGLVRVQLHRKHSPKPAQPLEGSQPSRRITFRCCTEEVKCKEDAIYCVICGKQQAA